MLFLSRVRSADVGVLMKATWGHQLALCAFRCDCCAPGARASGSGARSGVRDSGARLEQEVDLLPHFLLFFLFSCEHSA